MLVIMGRAASGKDTVVNKLVENHGFHKIITYTTRPIRSGEKQDVTYHYISKADFNSKIESGFFAEYKKYIVNNEIWYYGTAKDDLKNADEKSVIILTPDGIRDIQSNGINPVVIYIYSYLSTIRSRLQARNDKNDKNEDRIARDIKAFKNAEQLANKIVYNNEGADLETVINKVLTLYEEARNA